MGLSPVLGNSCSWHFLLLVCSLQTRQFLQGDNLPSFWKYFSSTHHKTRQDFHTDPFMLVLDKENITLPLGLQLCFRIFNNYAKKWRCIRSIHLSQTWGWILFFSICRAETKKKLFFPLTYQKWWEIKLLMRDFVSSATKKRVILPNHLRICPISVIAKKHFSLV